MIRATAYIVPEKGADFQKTEVELDAVQPHEVLVDLVATGICNTDLAVQHGKIPMRYPLVLGHEGAGIVRSVGNSVKDLSPGDHVVLSYNYCGQCRSCTSQHTYRCQTAREQNFGGKRPNGSQTIISRKEPVSTCFFGQSSFCNPAIVQEASCVKVDKDLPLSVVCALGCGFQTGSGSVYNVVKPLERKVRSLAIFGVGGVGCAAIMAARHLLATDTQNSYKIIAVDVNDDRLELAKEFGATHGINSRSITSLPKALAEIIGEDGLDAAIDCSGILAVVDQMIELIGPGGIAVTVGGPPPGKQANIDVFDMLIKCKTYSGCHQGNAYSKEFIPQLARLYREGHFPLERMQKTYTVEDINKACEDMVKGDVLKPILLWR